jgi:hypothetical protein
MEGGEREPLKKSNIFEIDNLFRKKKNRIDKIY